jgi:hypothetical protein
MIIYKFSCGIESNLLVSVVSRVKSGIAVTHPITLDTAFAEPPTAPFSIS